MIKMVFYISVILFTLTSCSKKEVTPRDEFSTPGKTYRLWIETAEKGDIENSMRCVTEASKRIMDAQIRRMDEFMKRSNENIKIFKTYTIVEQKSREDKAVVVLRGKRNDIIVVPLKKEAEGWKIDLISLFSGAG